MNNTRQFLIAVLLVPFLLLSYPGSAPGAQGMMKGPGSLGQGSTGQEQLETSAVKLVLQGGINQARLFMLILNMMYGNFLQMALKNET
jgi:hypothetical protein